MFALHRHCRDGKKVEENFQLIIGRFLNWRHPGLHTFRYCQQMAACVMKDCLLHTDPEKEDVIVF